MSACPKLHGRTGRTGCRTQVEWIGFPAIVTAECSRDISPPCNERCALDAIRAYLDAVWTTKVPAK